MIAGRRGVEASPNGQKLNGSPQASTPEKDDHMESLGESNDNIPADELRFAAQQARIATRNVKFAAMSPARKRMTIARDVIKWLRIGKLAPAGGEEGGSHYLAIFGTDANGHRQYLSATQERDEGVNGYQCTACAVGGLLAAASYREACQLFNTAGSLASGVHTEHQAVVIGRELERNGLFSAEQAALIEQAYERGVGVPDPSWQDVGLGSMMPKELVDRARAFGDKFELRVARMEAIMLNIIANKGTFAP